MHITHARDLCASALLHQHRKNLHHWLGRYAAFLLQHRPAKPLTTEQKIEAFLTRLAITGVSAPTQNQAFNALLFFYREVIKQELGPVNSLRAKRPITLRQAPTHEEVGRLLAAVADIFG